MSEDAKYLTIREWSEEDRPREKMLAKGCSALSDAELLAILIGSGSRNESAVDLAKRIMKTCQHNINELASLSVNDLHKKFKGIGEAKAVTIIAALEIGRRRRLQDNIQKKKISSSKDLFYLFEPNLGDLKHEEFWVALMDNGNKVHKLHKLTQGGSNQTIVDIPMLLQLALENKSLALAVAHNHPSGQKRPSKDDDKVTQKIKNGCEAIGIRLLDHIIIADGNYYSYCDEGKI